MLYHVLQDPSSIMRGCCLLIRGTTTMILRTIQFRLLVRKAMFLLLLFAAILFRAAAYVHLENRPRKLNVVCSSRSSLLSRESTLLQSTSTTCHTEATITVPRFADDEEDNKYETGFKYPSPLHRIHVVPALSETEAAHCFQLAHAHAATSGCWARPDRERHAAYATCDFPIEESPALTEYLDEIGLHERLWEELSQLYGIDLDDMTYLDIFCAHYQANDNDDDDDEKAAQTTMDRLEPHRDGSLLSFTIALSSPDDFEGGGTVFDALRDVASTTSNNDDDFGGVLRPGGVVRPLRAGHAVLHSGKLLHGARQVTAGERTVLVGFVEVAEWCTRPGVLSSACRDWGRMDAANYRLKRQRQMAGTSDQYGGGGSGWFLKNSRWLPQGTGRSYIQGFCPAFASVERRADPEYQRLKKLEAEDRLLRAILLNDEEKARVEQLEISIL